VDELDAVIVADIHDDDYNRMLKSPSLKRHEQEEIIDHEGLMLKRGESSHARPPERAARVCRF